MCLGPQYPLYLLGHKMLHCYPYVPVGGEMALNCAILTYNGTAYFGFSGDVHAAPDLRRLETLLQSSFEELREATRVTPPQKKKEGKKQKKRVRAKTTIAATPQVPAPEPVRASIPRPAPDSIGPAIASGPLVTEEKVLTQLIA